MMRPQHIGLNGRKVFLETLCHLRHFVWAWLFCIALLGLSGCRKENPDWDMGELSIPMQPFEEIEVRGVFDIELVQDGTWGVDVLASNKALRYLDIRMEGKTLILDRARKGDYRHPRVPTPQATVHFDSLHVITTHETCSIHSSAALTGQGMGLVDYSKLIEVDLELDMGTFYYWNTPNPSRLKLHGKANEIKLWMLGLSAADAEALESRYVLMENHSQGECKVRAIDKLEYSITSTGNILYYGRPTEVVQLQTEGSGKLIQGD